MEESKDRTNSLYGAQTVYPENNFVALQVFKARQQELMQAAENERLAARVIRRTAALREHWARRRERGRF